ncbi:hypothetical protein ACIBO9_24070 [Streptomyces prunicolor]
MARASSTTPVNAIAGDTGAEGRAVSYCDSAGFETSVDSVG